MQSVNQRDPCFCFFPISSINGRFSPSRLFFFSLLCHVLQPLQYVGVAVAFYGGGGLLLWFPPAFPLRRTVELLMGLNVVLFIAKFHINGKVHLERQRSIPTCTPGFFFFFFKQNSLFFFSFDLSFFMPVCRLPLQCEDEYIFISLFSF